MIILMEFLNKSNLSAYLAFVKKNKLEEVARESLHLSRELKIPLLELFKDLPDEVIIPRSMKSMSDFADQLADGSFISRQKENLQKWEDDKLEGVSKDQIQPTDLVLIYTAQKKALHKFIPAYTSDPELIIKIINELEEVHASVQNEAINMMFRWRQETEAALKQTNSFLDTLLENIPNMIFVKEAKELRFVRFNKAGEDLLGYNRDELIGKNDFDFFPKEQAEFFTSVDREVLKNDSFTDVLEEQVKTRFQGDRWLHTKKIPILNGAGKPAFLLGISEDITEEKQRKDEIIQLNKELEAFTYSVSHDLRAPLRAVNGYANMLEEDFAKELNDEGKRLLKTIRYNATKMGSLIDDLLTFSRLGKKELVIASENMNELMEGVLHEFNKNTKHNAEIVIDDLPPTEGEYGLLHQVFYNLVSNAVKYSSGKEKPKIRITGKENGSEVIYSVSDNGAGFDMKYAGKLFGVFQRLHSEEEFEGTGVGLAIVQRIVLKHHGRVWGEGKVNEGAVFHVALPAVSKTKNKK
jgi:PAS domain S-box-containing protein